MDIHRILADLKAERDRIDQAIATIMGIGSRRRRRPPGRSSGGRKRKRRLTPEGRKHSLR